MTNNTPTFREMLDRLHANIEVAFTDEFTGRIEEARDAIAYGAVRRQVAQLVSPHPVPLEETDADDLVDHITEAVWLIGPVVLALGGEPRAASDTDGADVQG